MKDTGWVRDLVEAADFCWQAEKRHGLRGGKRVSTKIHETITKLKRFEKTLELMGDQKPSDNKMP